MDSPNTKKLKGVVTQELFSVGSKSEHNALYLDTGKKKYRMKRRGGNPFQDDKLSELLGKKISAEGIIRENLFEIIGEPEVL